jgi:hypothetical protein
MFQFVDAHLSKQILHEARRQQQEIDDDAGDSSSMSKKQVTKLGDASDDSGDEAGLQDNMNGDYYENIVRIKYALSCETALILYLNVSDRITLIIIISLFAISEITVEIVINVQSQL